MSTGSVEQARVALGDPAEVLDLDALDSTALGQRRGDAAEPLRERDERAEDLHVLGALTAGTLTAVVTTPPVRAATTCSAVCTPARSCASAVEAPRCGVTTTLG